MKENNFKIIYKILSELETAMDDESIDKNKINAKAFEITENRWKAILKMLIDNDYIKGVSMKSYDNSYIVIGLENAKITLKGLEYLSENSIMKKIARGAKALVDVAPKI